MCIKTILSFFLCLLSIVGVKAQDKSYFVSGRILDSLTKKEMTYGTITLKRIRQIHSVSAAIKTNGTFTIELNAAKGDSLFMTISIIGYANKTITFVLTDSQTYQFSNLAVSPIIANLQEVTVAGHRSLFENKIDKIIYNVALDKEATTMTTADVIKRAPFISIDPFGALEIKGNTGVKVLINGKESAVTANGLTESLKNLPASNIKQIEVITNPSSKYDGEGINGIVNIITFKKPFAGFNGSSFGNVGTRNNAVGLDLNYGGKRSDIVTSINIGADDIKGNINYSTFDAQNIDHTSQSGNYKANTFFQNYLLAYTYSIDTTQSLSVSGSINPEHLDNNGSYQTYSVNNSISQSYLQTNHIHSNTTPTTVALDYIKSLGSDKDFFSSSIAWDDKINTDSFNTNYTSVYENLLQENKQKVSEVTGQADFSKAAGLKKDFIIETGLKLLHRVLQSNVNSVGSLFKINQDIYAQYFDFEKPFSKKISLKAGERTEFTNNSTPLVLSAFPTNNSYFTFFPSAIIDYSIDDNSDIKFAYTKRITRPNLLYLNPFVNATDPHNIFFGNPRLNPENSNNINLDYNKFWNKTSLTFSTYVNFITGEINRYEIISNDITQTTYLNTGSNKIYGIATYFNSNAVKNISINMGADYAYYTFTLNNVEVKDGGRFSFNINDTWKFTKTFRLNAYISYSTPKLFLQGSGQGSLYSVFTLRKVAFHGNGSIAIGVDNPFYDKFSIQSKYVANGYTYLNNNNFTGRSFRFNVFYSFGEEKRKQFIKAKGVLNEDLKKKEPDY